MGITKAANRLSCSLDAMSKMSSRLQTSLIIFYNCPVIVQHLCDFCTGHAGEGLRLESESEGPGPALILVPWVSQSRCFRTLDLRIELATASVVTFNFVKQHPLLDRWGKQKVNIAGTKLCPGPRYLDFNKIKKVPAPIPGHCLLNSFLYQEGLSFQGHPYPYLSPLHSSRILCLLMSWAVPWRRPDSVPHSRKAAQAGDPTMLGPAFLVAEWQALVTRQGEGFEQ